MVLDMSQDGQTRAESFYALWCEYDAVTKDPGAKVLGKMVMRLRDEIVEERMECRVRNGRNTVIVSGLYVILGALWVIVAAHVFGA
jgi:hypothetical protein